MGSLSGGGISCTTPQGYYAVSSIVKTVDEDEKIIMTTTNIVCIGQIAWFVTEQEL